ncbi:hypothetical protein S245_008778 [Arachis hypogaea]
MACVNDSVYDVKKLRMVQSLKVKLCSVPLDKVAILPPSPNSCDIFPYTVQRSVNNNFHGGSYHQEVSELTIVITSPTTIRLEIKKEIINKYSETLKQSFTRFFYCLFFIFYKHITKTDISEPVADMYNEDVSAYSKCWE